MYSKQSRRSVVLILLEKIQEVQFLCCVEAAEGNTWKPTKINLCCTQSSAGANTAKDGLEGNLIIYLSL